MKFRIQQDPTFTVDVDIPRAGGATVLVPFTFKFLDREQLSEHFESQQKLRDQIAEALDGGATVREVTSTVIDHQVETLTQIVAGWGFEDKLNEKSMRAFVTSLAAAPEAVIQAFAKGYDAARLGN